MDINNKEELKNLYSFTFFISGYCPEEVLKANVSCSKDESLASCVMCWRIALDDRIKELEK